MTGERILGGRYRLLSQLGQGGMGEVWRAVDELLDRRVAVKLILPGRVDSEEVVARFRREARLTARLAGHPNVVILHDFGQDGGDTGSVYAVMELVEGVPLTSVLRESGPVPVARAAALAAQAASGLGAAHAAGIVHRDVKPGNLMVVGEPPDGDTVKVLDFGIAGFTASSRTRRITQTGQIIGTPLYMPPEQIRGEQVGRAGDLYSLGAILYQLLTGQPPFRAEDPWAVLRMHLAQEARPLVELRREVPAALSDLVSSMLAKRVADRPATAEDVRDRLAAFAPSPALRPSRPRSVPDPGTSVPLKRTRVYTEAPPQVATTSPAPIESDPAVLLERMDAAQAKADGGQFAAAANELRALLPHLRAALGPDHPDTLRARRREAYCHGKSGEYRSAVAALDSLLGDLLRLHGPRHPETLTVRYYLATNTGRVGDHALAARLHGDLVPDLVAVHGPNASRVLTTRLYLAFETGEAGAPRQAVDLLDALIPDLTRALGEDDPMTLRARHYQAAYLGHAGDAAEAARRYHELFSHHTRVYGAQDPRTTRIRTRLRQWQDRARQ
ncbi:serine/threonine protein kinase [Nocardiopsis sp. Huas11]|uniref:serine/threonine-protein kinase n=1 Tax=Nocardiopsis sp. Huas11 TaxID=2183912 RepID=UPI000EB5B526|nr:protein kinase [Nocardiopsis sp. Huas11]RKS09613.1 serine/threonine protein kinase [Nocardiopsis sp. Huas11]